MWWQNKHLKSKSYLNLNSIQCWSLQLPIPADCNTKENDDSHVWLIHRLIKAALQKHTYSDANLTVGWQ